MKRMYVTDLDGTLLEDDATLSPNNLSMINQLIDKGVDITVASARSVQTIRKILSGLKLKLPIIAFNGAYVSDFNTGKHLIVNNIDKPELFEILEPYGALLSTYDEEDVLSYIGNPSEGCFSYINDRRRVYQMTIEKVACIPEGAQVMSYSVIDNKETIMKLKNELASFNDIIVDAWEDMYYRPWYWLSIHSKKATKAKAINSLKDIIDIDRKVIVFGDNTNDIEMFIHADEAYAVENAVEALKNHAHGVIGKNTEQSVVKRIFEIEGIEI